MFRANEQLRYSPLYATTSALWSCSCKAGLSSAVLSSAMALRAANVVRAASFIRSLSLGVKRLVRTSPRARCSKSSELGSNGSTGGCSGASSVAITLRRQRLAVRVEAHRGLHLEPLVYQYQARQGRRYHQAVYEGYQLLLALRSYRSVHYAALLA